VENLTHGRTNELVACGFNTNRLFVYQKNDDTKSHNNKLGGGYMKRLFVILLTLFPSLLMADGTNAIVGAWATEPTLGQLGMSITHYRFDTNATYECWVDFLSAKGMPKMTTLGKYELLGTNIILVVRGRTNQASFVLSGDVLLWTGEDKKTVKFQREKYKPTEQPPERDK
jgi:hypothetical protein